jgi:hypothetical protein
MVVIIVNGGPSLRTVKDISMKATSIPVAASQKIVPIEQQEIPYTAAAWLKRPVRECKSNKQRAKAKGSRVVIVDSKDTHLLHHYQCCPHCWYKSDLSMIVGEK